MNDFGIAQEATGKVRQSRRRRNGYSEDSGNPEFASKNLDAERRRRQKLHSRLLTLRSLVPNITNMNKGMIVEDAISYIKELKENVETLTEELLEMEETAPEEKLEERQEEIDSAEEMKKCGIQEEVQVTKISESKCWVKIIVEKKGGMFGKFIETMEFLGLEIVDISLATYRGAILVSSSAQGLYDDPVAVDQTRDLLLEMMRSA